MFLSRRWKRVVEFNDVVESKRLINVFEWGLAVKHFVQYATKCPDVRSSVRTLILKDFGRDVLLGPNKGVPSSVIVIFQVLSELFLHSQMEVLPT